MHPPTSSRGRQPFRRFCPAHPAWLKNPGAIASRGRSRSRRTGPAYRTGRSWPCVRTGERYRGRAMTTPVRRRREQRVTDLEYLLEEDFPETVEKVRNRLQPLEEDRD